MTENSEKRKIDAGNLHLWQLRNFQTKQESFASNVDVHHENVAHLLSSMRGDESVGSTCCLASKLFLDEMNFCTSRNDGDNESKLSNQSKLTSKLKEICENKKYNSIFKSGCQAPLNQMQKLLASSHCSNDWLLEVTDNPSVKLLKQKSIQISSNLPTSWNEKENDSTVSSAFCQSSVSSTNFSHMQQADNIYSNHRDSKRKFDDANDCNVEETSNSASCFKSAREQLAINQKQKFQRNSPQSSCNKKSLGSRPRNQCFAKFVPPSSKDASSAAVGSMCQKQSLPSQAQSDDVSPKLKGIEPQLVELVMSEIMDHGPPVAWDDIAGLEFAKATIKEVVIWPMLRPDIFTGLRGPPKGILLFGPPGTGKTLIGKCIANQSGATFFSISASSLTSKWIGQAEKMVRALFAVASMHQPAVIFIDEIDSLLSQRSDSEHESSRRIKTEFFVQLDGATTSSEDRILVVGATNRPQEIDEAARRRLVKRLYIPLPDDSARKQIITKLMTQQLCVLTQNEINEVVSQTDGYSGADVTNLCKDAALGPIRSLQVMDISKIHKNDVRPINIDDFRKSLQRVKASVSQKDLLQYEEWNKIYGCGSL